MNEWERRLLDEVESSARNAASEAKRKRQDGRSVIKIGGLVALVMIGVVGTVVWMSAPQPVLPLTPQPPLTSAPSAPSAPSFHFQDGSGNVLLTIVDNGDVETVRFPALAAGQCYTTWIPAVGSRCVVGSPDTTSTYGCYVRQGTPSVMNATRCCTAKTCGREVTVGVRVW